MSSLQQISIFDFSFSAPDKKKAGDILDAEDAKIFNYMWRKNALKVLKIYQTNHPEATKEDLQNQLKNIPLVFSQSEIEIENEAINIAFKLIVQKLEQENLPVPDLIMTHARELALNSPKIQAQAAKQVASRYKVVKDILSVLEQA